MSEELTEAINSLKEKPQIICLWASIIDVDTKNSSLESTTPSSFLENKFKIINVEITVNKVTEKIIFFLFWDDFTILYITINKLPPANPSNAEPQLLSIIIGKIKMTAKYDIIGFWWSIFCSKYTHKKTKTVRRFIKPLYFFISVCMRYTDS